MTPKSTKATWLGNFYGGSLGFLNYEVLSIQHIPHKDLAKETELMAVKWFDYRRLHPMQATYYFVKCYTNAYRDFCRRCVNADTAPFVRLLKNHDFLDAKEKLSIWRLRQLCDRMGMRYDFFLSYAVSWFHRMVGKNGKVYPPRPAHLLNNEELIADVMLAWEEQCNEVSMQFARDPYYRITNYVGSRDQQAHEAFVIAQIKRRRLQRYSLHSALYIYDVVRIEEAIRHFDVGIVNDAIKEMQVPD